MKSVIFLAAATMVCAGLAGSVRAQNNLGARIIDGSALFDYTTNGTGALPVTSNGPAGAVAMNFQIDGAPNAPGTRQIFRGNWFYRLAGDDRERHFANATTRTLTGLNAVEWTFNQLFTGAGAPTQVPGLSSRMSFVVTDTGPDSALLTSQVCFFNNGPNPVTIDSFWAVDIDLAATFLGDAYQPLNVSGGNRTWTLTDGSWTGIFLGPGAHGAGVDNTSFFFDPVIGAMTDQFANDFIPDRNPGGASPAVDNAAVMQWRFTIGAGGSICIPAYIGVGRNGVIPIVPEPAGASLLCLSALAAGFSSRRRASCSRRSPVAPG